MHRYTTIMKKNLEELEMEITEFKKRGYKLQGEPKINEEFYIQIMYQV